MTASPTKGLILGLALGAAVALPAAAATAPATNPLEPFDEFRNPVAPYKPTPPRMANGMPDWRGVWAPFGSRNMDPTTHSGARQSPPFTEKGRIAYEAAQKALEEGRSQTDIGCAPSGSPRIMRTPYPMEVVVTPEQTWVLSEFKGESRRIYTDGRKIPTDDELDYNFHGVSNGHWEGDTLVFDTIGLRAGTYDQAGLVHSDKLILHERMRRIDFNTLEDRITMVDPEVFSAPWTVTRHYKLRPEWTIKEFYCENERNPIGADGRTTSVLK